MLILRKSDYNFSESKDHTTYYGKDGIVPSSTTVLKILNKESLIHWANMLGWKRKRVKDELESTSLIGTAAHNVVEQIIRHPEKDLLNMMYEDDILKNQLNLDERDLAINAIYSFNKWWKHNSNKIDIIDIEKQMSCDTYGGTLDFVCKYNGKLVIIDFKTSKDFYFTQFLQLASYANLYKINEYEEVEDVAILRLDKKYGEEAELLFMSQLPCGSLSRYIKIFNKLVDIYYDVHSLETEWKHL